jgi:hypothetical protein
MVRHGRTPACAARGPTPVVCAAALDRRKLVAMALPIAVPVAMGATFTVTRDRFGDHIGYLAGFGAYWATCAGATLALLGRSDARRLFKDVRPRLGRPAALGAVLLLWPRSARSRRDSCPSLALPTSR